MNRIKSSLSHKRECHCAVCEMGWDKYYKWELEMFEKCGWFAHYTQISEGESSDPRHTGPMGVNFHTHGIAFKYNHPDLQIAFPCKPDTSHSLFWECVRQIEFGERFMPGDTKENIAGNGYLVKFVPVIEGEGHTERHVLRIILPDVEGQLEADQINHPYSHQYDDIKIWRAHEAIPNTLNEMNIKSKADIKTWNSFENFNHPAQLRRIIESN